MTSGSGSPFPWGAEAPSAPIMPEHSFLPLCLLTWLSTSPSHAVLDLHSSAQASFPACVLCSCFGKREWVGGEGQLSHLRAGKLLAQDWCSWLARSGSHGSSDRDRWWHTRACQLEMAGAWMRRNAFLISKAWFLPPVKAGHWGVAAWWRMYFLLFLRFRCEVSNHMSGLLLVLSLKSVVKFPFI